MSKNDEVCIKGNDEVKTWMETHPHEYAEFSAKMKEQGIGAILKLGEEAFFASPTFKQKVEMMVSTGQFDASALLESLSPSDFAANYFKGKNDDLMAMAAWIKFGESPELIVRELDKEIVGQDKRKYRGILSSLLKLFWDKYFQRRYMQRKEISSSIQNLLEQSSSPTLLCSQDGSMLMRIGEWASCRCSGMDTAHLYIALIETGELNARMPLTQFVDAMRAAYPNNSIVGVRQLQKSVSYLQNLSPNRKQYGKDEPEHRFAIDAIKTEVLLASNETLV